VHTNLLVGLDVIAFCFAALVLRRELCFPHFEIVPQYVAPLLGLGDAHDVRTVLRKQDCGEENRLGD
jgi:hypothetical protein